MVRKIDVVSYNPLWPSLFEEEANKIRHALKENFVAVHHVGSTSVPELLAKPTIDILAVVKDRALVAQEEFKTLGYTYRGEFNIPFHLGFSKRESFPKVNLHIFEEGNPEIELNLLFRDFLRHNSETREAYAALKLNLVSKESSHNKINSLFSGYNLGKDSFIKKVLIQAGFKGLCMRFCTHYEEWEAGRAFRQKYFFDKMSLSDPYTWTFNHKDHVHLVFYQGTAIIGYGHIQLCPEQGAVLLIIVIDEPLRNQGFGGHFLKLCERWLKQKGFEILQTQSPPAAYRFYAKHGYVEMPFNDPERYESDSHAIDLGKRL